MRHLLLVLFALLDSLDIGNPDPDSDIKLILYHLIRIRDFLEF